MINASFLLCVLLAGATTQLSGRVVDQDDRPVQDAIVVISTAKPRVGPATTCPSCYRDCTKRTLTDDQGRFKLDGLSSKLLFSLAAGGAGYHGMVSEHFDPSDFPAITLILAAAPESPDATFASGTVLDRSGSPIAGAEVRSRTIHRIGGRDEWVSPLTLTDDEGRFRIAVGKHIRAIDFRFSAAGFAAADVHWMRAENRDVRAELGPGASLRGRLLLNGDPLASVEVGLVQENRIMGNIVTPVEVSTDAEGFFQFDHLPPGLDYAIYTHTGQDARGVLPVSLIQAPEHGQRAELGDIAAVTPHRLTVKVVTNNGKRLPDKSVVYVGRRKAWRGSTLTLPPVASAVVQINDLGREPVEISVRVPGLKVISCNPPLNEDLNRRYTIRVNGNTEIIFVVGE